MADVFSKYLLARADDFHQDNRLPLDVVAIAHEVGAKLEIGIPQDGRHHAWLERHANRATIFIRDPGYSKPRGLSPKSRFAVAHEIGHLLLWRKFGLAPTQRSEYWKHEALCDDFAGHLLVPTKVVKEQAARFKDFPFDLPAAISRMTAASIWVAANRVTQLHPSLLFFWLTPETRSQNLRLWKVRGLSVRRTTFRNAGEGSIIGPRSPHHDWFEQMTSTHLGTWQAVPLGLALGSLSVKGGLGLARHQGSDLIQFCILNAKVEHTPKK